MDSAPRPALNPVTCLWEWAGSSPHLSAAQPRAPEGEPEGDPDASAGSLPLRNLLHGAAQPINNKWSRAEWPPFESCDTYYAVWQLNGAPEWQGVVWGPGSWKFICSMMPGNCYDTQSGKLQRFHMIVQAIWVYKQAAHKHNAPAEPDVCFV